MSPPVERDRKRQRTSHNRATDEEDHAHTDDDASGRHHSDDLAPRPGQAERKRELERNRRNLVNVRFVELEAELRRCVPRPDPPDHMTDTPAPAKGKRIDKEAVLKDAAQRLAVQRKDLASAAERMAAMAAEIENLRAEKVELRGDKSYLRSELETVRGDLQRLRSDNINLWQAFKKASSFKDSFAPDVAKLPAELFLRTDADQLQSAAAGNTMVHPAASLPTGHGLPPISSPQSLLGQRTQSAASLQQAQLLSQQQHQQQHHQRQRHPRSHNSSPLLSGGQPRDLQQSVPAALAAGVTSGLPSSNLNTDSFLILQSAEELGELFSNYVPGAMIPNFGTSGPPRSEPQQQIPNPRTGTLDALPTSSGAQPAGFGTVQFPQGTQATGKTHDPAEGNPFVALNVAEGANMPSAKSEKEEREPTSDVAYCV